MVRQQLLIKYYLQQSMASKAMKSREIRGLRSSWRGKVSEQDQPKESAVEKCVSEDDSKDAVNPVQEQKQQQIKEKNEKDSTSQFNNEPPAHHYLPEKQKRVTRSSLISSKLISSDPQPHHDPLTPDDHPLNKISEELTSKKLAKHNSAVQLGESAMVHMALTVKKSSCKLPQMVSPYSEIRKSYRKNNRREIESIPYRKCHDVFEGRIVTIINKIESGKNCLKDFESLIEKMQRITTKDMMNRYIVAGIRTIVRVAGEKNLYEPKIMERLDSELKRLILKIGQELDRIDYYQDSPTNKTEEMVNSHQYKSLVMRKIYRILKRQGPSRSSRELRERTMGLSEKLFDCEVNIGKIVRFLRGMENLLEQ